MQKAKEEKNHGTDISEIIEKETSLADMIVCIYDREYFFKYIL